MDRERERRINQLLVASLERDPDEREVFLREASDGDSVLVEEVLRLLDGEEELGDFLELPATLGGGGPGPGTLPEHLGPYRILEPLGAGGMGEVYRAEQEEPVRRQVALKVIRTHLQGRAKARFLVEQKALARLGHTHIARFFEAGTTPDGQPWFAMELADGETLTAYCDEQCLSLEARLEIFLGVCAAVEHAHRQQILHRDLKPTNVLVIEEDGRPVPKVIDFGIAKALDGGSDEPLQTEGLILGTPAYMSPEAMLAFGQGGSQVDTRTDVYSLGVLLFELVTGHRPYGDDDSSLGELLKRIEMGVAELPSRKLGDLEEAELAEVARQRSLSPQELNRQVVRDLDWIVARALAANLEERYGSVGELSADLERFLRDEVVLARPPSLGYRLGKALRRHRLAAAAALIAILGIVVGGFGLGFGLIRAQEQAAAAEEALLEAREVSDFLVRVFEAGNPNLPGSTEVTVEDLLDQGVVELRDRFADQPAARGRFLKTIADVYVQLGRFEQAEAMLIEASKLFETTLPEADPAQSGVLRSLGVLQIQQGNYEDANDALGRALTMIDPELEPETWALSRHNQGVALLRLSHFDESEAAFLEALDVRERHLPPDHPHLGRSYNALGAVFLETRGPADALPYFEKSAEYRERVLGPDHPSLAKSFVNLAQAYLRLTQAHDGIEWGERAFEIEKKALGEEHPDLVRTTQLLAELHLLAGNEREALSFSGRSLELAVAAFGEDGARTGSSLVAAGNIHRDLGRFDEARILYERAIPIYQARYTEDRLWADNARLGLGLIQWKQGDLEGAHQILSASLERREHLHPGEPWAQVFPLRGLAGIAKARGDLEEAERLSCRAILIIEETKTGERSFQKQLREELAETLRASGRGNEAERALQRGSGICERPT